MKQIFLYSAFIVFVIILSSCSETSSLEYYPLLNIRTEMTLNTITGALLNKGVSPQSSGVDSIQLKRIRILLTQIAFHSATDNDSTKEIIFDAGPLIFQGDSLGLFYQIASSTFPTGTYDKIKFEVHRFTPNEILLHGSDSSFMDFASQDRYSVVIDGKVFKGGNSYKFTYKGAITANLSFKFVPSLVFQNNTTTNIYLQVNPIDLMKTNNSLLDPRDSTNANDINNLIRAAIKAVKR